MSQAGWMCAIRFSVCKIAVTAILFAERHATIEDTQCYAGIPKKQAFEQPKFWHCGLHGYGLSFRAAGQFFLIS